MSDVEVYRPAANALPAKVQYARELANSGLLPAAYRRNPPNILWAMEYGDMLGLSHMAAITGVHVIEGKPTASAGLISALVRRAGHKLRVRGDDKSATCEIVRSDDPEYTFSVTFTMADAAKANLTGKPVWKQYGPSMLKSRAITQCARDACEEVLFGLHYTPEELGAEVDGDGAVLGEAVAEAPSPPAAQDGPADDPWMVHPDPDAASEWVQGAIEKAAGLTDKGAATALYEEAVAKAKAGEITSDQKNQVCDLIIAAMDDQPKDAAPVEGSVAAPDGDPWQAEIGSMSTKEDALPLLDKLEAARTDGTVDGRRYTALKAAIRTKAGQLPSAPEPVQS